MGAPEPAVDGKRRRAVVIAFPRRPRRRPPQLWQRVLAWIRYGRSEVS